jgi:hypothetical protein
LPVVEVVLEVVRWLAEEAAEGQGARVASDGHHARVEPPPVVDVLALQTTDKNFTEVLGFIISLPPFAFTQASVPSHIAQRERSPAVIERKM